MDNTKKPRHGDLRVCWFPQVPCKPFIAPVGGLMEGRRLLNTLAYYDRFQFENRIKPDYANMGSLQHFVDGEWEDFSLADGRELEELSDAELRDEDQMHPRR